ncbi:hypothetical protein JCGZ_11378 [Jatropha curcas]|uniref:Small ribosomal subunit protein mS38 n=1 Tax=Jatropha curcas TaxID=180498 RepID=A0A067K4E5_JATCU|nr:uncharacterized protein LOC105640277 [Jatropha curcas]KDP31002.1 hypothetical protein JCGZ_11378 [Jatropha curcas]
MASLINQVARKATPSLRTIAASIKTPLLCNPAHTNESSFINNSIPLWDSASTVKNPIVQNPTKPFQFYYPSFPFGYCLKPISITGSNQLDAIGADFAENDTDDAKTVWADSVKKKRKKKMNKHKYKKLRKRLRRKA